MQNLNDRLASYIDEVRKRDIEIGNLQAERSTIEETHIEIGNLQAERSTIE